MKIKIRVWTMILALLILVSALVGMVACQDTPGPGPDVDPGTDPGTDPGDDPVEERIPTDYLPEVSYATEDGPRNFHILEWDVSNGTQIIWREGDVEELDGSKLSEAVFARNAAVEERYDVEITSQFGPPESMLPLAAASGDDLYQLVTQRSLSLYPMINEAQFYDLNDYSEYIHTDMPWWVQGSIESYTLGDHLYVASSEMLQRDKGAANCVTFNKSIAEQYEDLADFYRLVSDNKWTIGELAIASEIVSHSDDGDELMNSENDMWGVWGWQEQASYFYVGAGYQYARVNEDGQLMAEFGDVEETAWIYADIFENVMFTEWFYDQANEKEMVNPTGDMFKNDQALFAIYALIELPYSMETDYGVLPIPGYSEEQLAENGYHTLVYMHGDCVVGIPSLTNDPEFSAVMLEAISWESYYTVYPVFFEELLFARWLRDNESVEMMHIILDNRTYDPGQFWGEKCGLFALDVGLCATAMQKKESSIASMWASCGDAFKEAMGKMNDLANS